ncbi:hypothetical protein ACTXPK_08720 [Glutamicibacter arilaitensis]
MNHRHKPHPADVAQPPDTQTATAEVTAAERRASEFATHGDPTLAREGVDPVSKRPGMQWVRPTDLAARAGGAIVDRGADLNLRLRDAVLAGVREGRAQLQERLARRQLELDPETTQAASLQRSLGRSGVSR